MPRPLRRPAVHLTWALACGVLLSACTAKSTPPRCEGEREVAMLAMTPAGVPAVRLEQLGRAFEVEFDWRARKWGLGDDLGPHPPFPVLSERPTLATFTIEGRPGRATYAGSVRDGVCETVLVVPVALTVRTSDGRVDTTIDAQADFRDGRVHISGGTAGLAIRGLELPDCDPYSTGFGLLVDDETVEPSMFVLCKADEALESYVPRKWERLAIPRVQYTLGVPDEQGDEDGDEAQECARNGSGTFEASSGAVPRSSP